MHEAPESTTCFLHLILAPIPNTMSSLLFIFDAILRTGEEATSWGLQGNHHCKNGKAEAYTY